jgi:hypothetical protein
MSREYLVLIVDEPPEFRDIDDMPARVFMRFTEQPDDEFLGRISAENRGKRVYCLLGASTWWVTA